MSLGRAVVPMMLAGLATVVVIDPSPHLRWRRGVGAARTSTGTMLLVSVAVVSTIVAWRAPVVWVAAPVLLAAGGYVVRARLVAMQRRRWAADRRQMVIELCDALVAELRAGLGERRALANACRPWPELEPIVAGSRLGGEPATAFRRLASAPGADGLRLVAACWDVSARSGAGLAAVLDQVGAALRDGAEARAEVTAALGPPRATAKLLAVLPLLGLGLGTSMGARPIEFLLTTPIGLGCLGLGLVLVVLGVWWVERLAAAVEE